LETKFIGLDGYDKIETMPTTKKRRNNKNSKKLNTAQKTVRFVKRASVALGKSAVSHGKSFAGVIYSKSGAVLGSSKKAVISKKSASVLDKCYRENRVGNSGEFRATVKDAVADISTRNTKKYAHSSNEAGIRAHSFLRKKAVLAVVACITAITVSCITVAGALETPANSGEPDNSVVLNAVATGDEAVSEDIYSSISDALEYDGVFGGCAGLYVDGELIGITRDVQALNDALEQVLIDYRADYDDETTTEFANDVEVKSVRYDEENLKSVDEIIEAAQDKLSIALSTDIVYTQEIPYGTVTEYDDDESTSYEKVKSDGVNGEEEITYRATFVDGVQTDAVVTESRVISEAVDEVVIKGTKEGGTTGTFIWPMPYTHTLSSEYGWRWGRLHGGLDISDSGIYGQSIIAADGGTVTYAGYDESGYGNYVMIDHGNGYTTLYGHCSSLAVSTGETVEQGQTVGYVGSTGNSTGPHLHFEIRVNGEQVDPLGYVS
jgi:murein DD-endopeptidase MepM/ murein hydrolase activator NlpD